MIRRQFIKSISALGISGVAFSPLKSMNHFANEDLILGHGEFRYKVDLQWGVLNSSHYPVNDCHEMVQDSKGRIVLLTNHKKNNVIIYDKKGNLVEVWGTEFPGAHGLTLNVEGGEDFLYITDTIRHAIFKTTIDGRVVKEFPCPVEHYKYLNKSDYVPTETAVDVNGDVYVADGYGLQNILQYSEKGELLNVFGGRGDRDENLDNAHGICIDNRNGQSSLLITDRMKNQLKRFTLGGQLLSITDLHGAYICRPVINKENVFLATIWSGNGAQGTGFISILDQDNKLISAPGGSTPVYENGRLKQMYQTQKVFTHPHDVCVDDDENLYVAQWNAGKTYPIKLYRV